MIGLLGDKNSRGETGPFSLEITYIVGISLPLKRARKAYRLRIPETTVYTPLTV